MANAVRPSVSKEIASTTPQVRLVAGSHLGFAENLFKLRNDKIRIVMANAVWRSVGKEIAAPCIQHGSQQEACGKFSRECQEPCARTAGKCKDAKKSGVSPSTREGSGKWLCLGLNS